jgi:hypothetical protein
MFRNIPPNAEELGVTRAVCRCVQDGINVAEDFLRGVVVLVAGVDEVAEVGGEVFDLSVSPKKPNRKQINASPPEHIGIDR